MTFQIVSAQQESYLEKKQNIKSKKSKNNFAVTDSVSLAMTSQGYWRKRWFG